MIEILHELICIILPFSLGGFGIQGHAGFVSSTVGPKPPLKSSDRGYEASI